MFQLSQAQIDHLIQALKAFHQNNPLSSAFEALYARSPVELMVRTFLAAVFEPDNATDSARALAHSAIEAELPYVVLMGDINFLQQEVVRVSDRHAEDPVAAFLEVSTAFGKTRAEVARVYLFHAVAQNGLLQDAGELKGHLLLQIYERWFTHLREAVLAHDLSMLKELSQAQQHFSDALLYPESQMVCMDAHSCQQLARYHQLILEQTLLLYHKLLDEAFEETLVIYNELVAQVRRLAALLTTLYFNYETNRLGIFFQYVQQQATEKKPLFLGLVNPGGLGRVNRLKGEAAGDDWLRRIEQVLLTEVTKALSWVSVVRGLSGDFYLLLQSDDARQVEAFLHQLLEAADTAGLLNEEHGDGLYWSAVYLPLIEYLDGDNLRRVIQFLHKPDEASEAVRVLASQQAVEPINVWVRQRLESALDIRSLLERKKVAVLLQPIEDFYGETLAFEALGRLSTQGRELSVGLFIDQLLELGLMERFDRIMLDAIAQEGDTLRETTRRLFINASSVSIASDDYVAALLQCCAGPLQGIEVVLELTEQAMLRESERIRQLHEQHGLVFAIDDFGAGYSSLSMVIDLAELGAVSWLKIDGSLTRRLEQNKPGSERLFTIIQQMADAVNLSTVVEWIESELAFNRLRLLGMDAGQGFYLGKPETVEKWAIRQRLLAR